MADTIADMDIEIKQKDNKIEFSEKKIRLPDSIGMNRLGLNKLSSKENVVGLWID